MQGGSLLVAVSVGYSLVSAWDLSVIVVGVNSVVVVVSISSSCGVQAPLSLWCEVHLY